VILFVFVYQTIIRIKTGQKAIQYSRWCIINLLAIGLDWTILKIIVKSSLFLSQHLKCAKGKAKDNSVA